MIYLFSRCYGGLFHRHMIILKLFYLLYTSFMLNDQSTDSGCMIVGASINRVWVHVVNRRVFSRSNKYTF